jgi:hypothetical protein
MASYDVLAARVRQLTESRFKEFEQQLLRGKAEAERNAAFQKKRIKRRREFLSSIGTDLKKFDAALVQESRELEGELKAFLEEYRPKSVSRPSAAADAARDAAIRSAVLGETGHMVLPAFASSIFTPDRVKGEVAIGPDWNPGAIDSGWVFQDPPQIIPIKDSYQDISLCWSNRYTPPPVYSTYFTFRSCFDGYVRNDRRDCLSRVLRPRLRRQLVELSLCARDPHGADERASVR